MATSEVKGELVTTATGKQNRSDPWEMALIHRLLGHSFSQASEAVLRPGPESRVKAVASYVTFRLDGLEAHHTSEDALIWPALYDRASPSNELIRRMESQHELVHEAIDTVRREAGRWQQGPGSERAEAVAASIRVLLERLNEHLAEEERDVVPLIAAHISQQEWEHLGKTSFGKFTPAQRFTAMGEMLAVAKPQEAARMLKGLPAPVRLVWKLIGRRKYDRTMAQVRG